MSFIVEKPILVGFIVISLSLIDSVSFKMILFMFIVLQLKKKKNTFKDLFVPRILNHKAVVALSTLSHFIYLLV